MNLKNSPKNNSKVVANEPDKEYIKGDNKILDSPRSLMIYD